MNVAQEKRMLQSKEIFKSNLSGINIRISRELSEQALNYNIS